VANGRVDKKTSFQCHMVVCVMITTVVSYIPDILPMFQRLLVIVPSRRQVGTQHIVDLQLPQIEVKIIP
jgi:hypothetical protein